jgi:hypothetical protein
MQWFISGEFITRERKIQQETTFTLEPGRKGCK